MEWMKISPGSLTFQGEFGCQDYELHISDVCPSVSKSCLREILRTVWAKSFKFGT